MIKPETNEAGQSKHLIFDNLERIEISPVNAGFCDLASDSKALSRSYFP
jgi:hypothetical protein